MPVLSTPEVDLHYELSGSGPPLVLIQGVGCIGETWRPQVKGLGEEWETMVFDNRSIGRSLPCRGPISIKAMAADAQVLMDAAGWESAHVAGHSMGGLIAQQLALDAPRRVRSLCLQCTFSRGREAARLSPWVLWMNLRIRLGTRRARRLAFLKMVMPPEAVEGARADALAVEMSALVGRDLCDQPAILFKQLMAMSRHDVSSKLGALRQIPTLVLAAEYDRIARPKYGHRLASLIPGASFELLPGASHAVTIHDAATVNDRMRAFLRTSQEKWEVLPR